MSDQDFKPPPLAADTHRRVGRRSAGLHHRRAFEGVSILRWGFVRRGSRRHRELAIRTRLSVIALKEACLVIGELGQPEAAE